MFAFLALLNGEQLSNNKDLVPPLWMVNSLVLVILGIFTMRRSNGADKEITQQSTSD